MNKGQIIISTTTPPLQSDWQTVDSDHLNRDFLDTVANAQRLGYEQTSIQSDAVWTGTNEVSTIQIVAIKEGR